MDNGCKVVLLFLCFKLSSIVYFCPRKKNTEQIIKHQRKRRLSKTLLMIFYCRNTLMVLKKRLGDQRRCAWFQLYSHLLTDGWPHTPGGAFPQHNFVTGQSGKEPTGNAVAVASRNKPQHQRNKEKMCPPREVFSAVFLLFGRLNCAATTTSTPLTI